MIRFPSSIRKRKTKKPKNQKTKKPKNQKTKKKMKIRVFKSYKKGKTESIKWIRIPFPSRRGKNEKRKWKSNFGFLRQRKTKNENKICFIFLTIENRLALRYTDFIAPSFWFKSSSIKFLFQISVWLTLRLRFHLSQPRLTVDFQMQIPSFSRVTENQMKRHARQPSIAQRA